MTLPKKLSQHVINYGLMAALALMLSFLVFGEWGLLHYQRLSEERRMLEERSQALQRENELLREKIYRITKDDRYLEKVAREDFGLARKGEIIFLFPGGGVKEAGAKNGRSRPQD